MLLIFGGLPATGKSTVSLGVAQALDAVHLRVDAIEQTLRDIGYEVSTDEGYKIAYRIAADNLELGRTVVSESVNPIAITRDDWRNVGEKAKVPVREIEVICSDESEHRHRVENRVVNIEGLRLPTWEEVRTRRYDPWPGEPLRIDTAGEPPKLSIEKVLNSLHQ